MCDFCHAIRTFNIASLKASWPEVRIGHKYIGGCLRPEHAGLGFSMEATLAYGTRVFTLALLLLLGACSVNPEAPASTNLAQTPAHETTLLVNLEDGSVIKQTINVDADLCFKQIGSKETTCFTTGDAIISPETNAIIGYEMIENHIDLIARSY